MGLKLHSRLLRINFLLLFPLSIYSQSWEKVDSVNLKDQPSAYAVDFQDNLYLGFPDGRLSKYEASGNFLENFSVSNNSSITLIDVQNNLKPFLFYFDNQQITILDRFSSVPKDYFLSDLGLDIVMMACPSPDGDFWVIENNPLRLKKVNPLRKTTVLDVQIQLGDSIRRMQAYQNILIIADEENLNAFDLFGGQIYSIKLDDLKDFQMVSGRLFAFTTSEVLEISLFKGQILKSIPRVDAFPLRKSKEGFLSIGNRLITYYENK